MRGRATLLPALAAAAGLALGASAIGASRPAVEITAVGDMAMVASSDGGASFFAGVRRNLTGDVVFGNLEGTLTNGSSSKCGASSTNCYSFHAPPSYARLLRAAGFNLLNVANNHALDYGTSGQADTIAALDASRLAHTGRPGEIAYLRVRGLTVAVLGFAPYPWAQSLTNIPAAETLVRHAVEAADLVVVTMHAGAEGSLHQHVKAGTEVFLGEDRGNPIAFAHAVVDAGADLVVGSGPHVLRAMEWYHGRLIAYSLGNFLGNGTLNIDGVSGVSAVLHVRLHGDGTWAGGTIDPVRLVSPGVPTVDGGGQALADLRSLGGSDLGRRSIRISAAGAITP